jgi:hypothetical protein
VSLAREPIGARRPARSRRGEPALVRLELPAGPSCRAVGRLVVGGTAARLGFEVEQVEDLQLAVEALLARAPARRSLRLELAESKGGLRLRVGPLAAARDDRERVLTMLRALVQDADVQDSPDGEWIVLRATRSRPPARSR